MKALRFEKTGSLDELKIQEVPRPAPGPGSIVVAVKAAGLNPSDAKNVLGRMHQTKTPRIPGRDFAGIVAVGTKTYPAGMEVFGSGGNLGFARDGSHAEYVEVPAEAVQPKPRGLTFEQAATVGIPYLTAWHSIIDAASLKEGENVLITGTTGAVGDAALCHSAHRHRGAGAGDAAHGDHGCRSARRARRVRARGAAAAPALPPVVPVSTAKGGL